MFQTNATIKHIWFVYMAQARVKDTQSLAVDI